MNYHKLKVICPATIILLAVVSAMAQTTAFNFQGRLNDGNAPANGKYDLQFKLFDAPAGGNQTGSTVAKSGLTLVNGVFSTPLDFGAAAFDGGNRFIEIGLRQSVTGNTTPNAFVILGPRQQILSVPYTIRSLNSSNADNATNAANAVNATNATNATNSTNLGGVPATNYLRYDANGNVGIGGVQTSTPSPARLYVQGETISGQTTGTALYAKGNSYVEGTVGISGDVSLGGNIKQSFASNGLPKAMAVYDVQSETIVRCYNSTLTGNATTTLPCGFVVNHFTAGGFGFNFGFDVRNRFVSITTAIRDGFSNNNNVGVYYDYGTGNNTVDIRTYLSGESETTRDSREFTIILF